jgi:hypothetical protein
VRDGLEQFVAQTGANELIIASQIYDPAARIRSYEITANIGIEQPLSNPHHSAIEPTSAQV